MKALRYFVPCLALLFGVAISPAKDVPAQVLVWPSSGAPILRFSFGKFKEVSSLGNQHTFLIDTTVDNLWTKPFKSAVFNLYMFDKGKARIGEGWISLNNVGPGETVKFQTTMHTSGMPVSLEIQPSSLPPELGPAAPPKTIGITVNSVPQGASLKLDGTDLGTTPKTLQVAVGKHTLEFSKEGFNTGHFPLEIGPNDASGGSVSYELGTSAHDTIELRDGSVLTGDLESMSATDVVVRVGGALQHFDRNQVKRILFVEREAAAH